MLTGFFVCGLFLLTVEGRSIDDEQYNEYMLRNLPTLLEELKVLLNIFFHTESLLRYINLFSQFHRRFHLTGVHIGIIEYQ